MPLASVARRDDRDGPVGVVQDRVLDRADARARAVRMAVSATYHEIGAGGIAGESPGGMSVADVLAAPGYSTAAEVTDLAGRGVGLDAVKIYAQSLGGSLEVRSQPGRGLSVVLLLPLAIVCFCATIARADSPAGL